LKKREQKKLEKDIKKEKAIVESKPKEKK